MVSGAATDRRTAHDSGSAGITWRGLGVLTVAVLAALAMYGVGVLLPYYGNELDRLPLSEVASGAYDPKDLGPSNALGAFLHLAGVLSLVVLPFTTFVALGVGGVSVVDLWRRRRPQRVPKSLVLLLVMAAATAGLAFMSTAPGEALTVWQLD